MLICGGPAREGWCQTLPQSCVPLRRSPAHTWLVSVPSIHSGWSSHCQWLHTHIGVSKAKQAALRTHIELEVVLSGQQSSAGGFILSVSADRHAKSLTAVRLSVLHTKDHHDLPGVHVLAPQNRGRLQTGYMFVRTTDAKHIEDKRKLQGSCWMQQDSRRHQKAPACSPGPASTPTRQQTLTSGVKQQCFWGLFQPVT